ncbi:DUF2270 domain-containing protein [Salipiger mangrovisoli]|uniref:DUF2270 domain-containing protein n=1 Tax=Salipiger mangrovisoli TaxID=2865933 RepID=A0ABR9WVZ7_9RHOB|nr:DUF2270 domain-containing protein [Salipiger mangrovisoli]MBE9635468.1 DUF2270 domain-containing protein [Salipiger mangrovisoli]
MKDVQLEVSGRPLDGAEIGALAHLYRSEVYRCTVWRTRLDTTTNWAVVTLGVALSIAYAAPDASPLPLVLVGISNLFFLTLEARRYRYCDLWRWRFRCMEVNFYGPMLGRPQDTDRDWARQLRDDYERPEFGISYLHAMGRRIRRSYLWIMLIQLLAFLGKITVHPTPVQGFEEAMRRASVGAIPGEAMAFGGLLYAGTFAALAVWSLHADRRARIKHDLTLPDAIY